MEMTLYLSPFGSSDIAAGNFLLLCAVPPVDLGKSFRCQHLADTTFPDAYP